MVREVVTRERRRMTRLMVRCWAKKVEIDLRRGSLAVLKCQLLRWRWIMRALPAKRS